MENVKLFFSRKSQFHLIEKIKNKNKKRTRASLFQPSEDGKQENVFMWPYHDEATNIHFLDVNARNICIASTGLSKSK